ncbi:hypothetical protein QVD17_07994 [Tagetes erecta]|uniref:Uncharacterized protein n=1 Tax=Tagetes erecta TaxID=13708 RepID=A0AAD8KXK4_TARER|nr:hypothetical protein QVD17_07994 [Tagetes erecta]
MTSPSPLISGHHDGAWRWRIITSSMSMAAEMSRARRPHRAFVVGRYVEYFYLLPKPRVRLFGAAKCATGRPLANLVELIASPYRYRAVVELPQVNFCNGEVEWIVDEDNEVIIEGQITPAAIYAGGPRTGIKRNRVQLCPTKPWAISFYFPGPVDWKNTLVFFTEERLMTITVVKRKLMVGTSGSGSTALVPAAETSGSGSTALVPAAETSGSGSTALVPAAETSGSGSTALVPVAETSGSGSTALLPVGTPVTCLSTFMLNAPGPLPGPGPEGDALLNPSETNDMVDGSFE